MTGYSKMPIGKLEIFFKKWKPMRVERAKTPGPRHPAHHTLAGHRSI
jgi:hypothetical protein